MPPKGGKGAFISVFGREVNESPPGVVKVSRLRFQDRDAQVGENPKNRFAATLGLLSRSQPIMYLAAITTEFCAAAYPTRVWFLRPLCVGRAEK